MTISKARMVILRSQTLGRTDKSSPHLEACRECEKKFKGGDEIVTKKNKRRTRWYCKPCAIKLNIWWEDGT